MHLRAQAEPAIHAACSAAEMTSLYRETRAASLRLAAGLSPEDEVVQSMPDASPVKWHLAHTTWFFETFFLAPAGVAPFDPVFGFLFNSYYEALGARHPRPLRGLLTRPSSAEVRLYRAHVDAHMERLILDGAFDDATLKLLDLGLAHEEQHQELILMDVLHLLSQNPIRPAYRPAAPAVEAVGGSRPMQTVDYVGGVVEIGWRGPGFAFDNEGPAHPVLLTPYRLADRLVTNGEWLAFIADRGYARPELWLSDGWAKAQADGWEAPLYWERTEAGPGWRAFGLDGLAPLDLDAPVVHVSFYEADAYARWTSARLPTEAEWENAAAPRPIRGNFVESDRLRPVAAGSGHGLRQLYGDVWEWTATPYAAYPGFRPDPGAVGEYNGKFMINQMVLRGGACVTPERHVRPSYRNFFHPHQRWQFAGVRLAYDAA